MKNAYSKSQMLVEILRFSKYNLLMRRYEFETSSGWIYITDLMLCAVRIGKRGWRKRAAYLYEMIMGKLAKNKVKKIL